MKRVLVVVDYQNDFVTGSLGFNQSENISDKIYALVMNTISKKDLLIFTKDTHNEDYLKTREGENLPVPHCIKGTQGHKLFGKLEDFEDTIMPNVVILEKDTFGSFDLINAIENEFSGEPDVIEFCGVVTNICVLSNIVIAMNKFKKAKIVLHENACAAIETAKDGNMHYHAIKVLESMGVEII